MLAVVLIAAQPAFANHTAGGPANDLLLPDVRTKEPERMSIATSGSDRLLRFDNEVGNAHTGPMEVFGVGAADCDGDGTAEPEEKPAFQRIFHDANNDGVFQRNTDTANTVVQTGCLAYHPQHDHLHFQEFASYRLLRISDGSLAASSSKVSFCIIDSHRFFSTLPGSPASPFYGGCAAAQGISVGWADEYNFSLPDQFIVINPNGQYVGDGSYCLVSTADSGGHLQEDNNAGNAEANNAASVRLTLSGGGTNVSYTAGSTCGGVEPEPWNDVQAPSAPSNLNASALSSTFVRLTWTPGVDTGGVVANKIYRDGNLIATVGAVNGYTDGTAVNGTTYRYTVRAVDSASNESAPSNEATVTTPATTTLRIQADADARVLESKPNNNYGQSAVLKTEGGTDLDTESYLRFTVSGVTGFVENAKLRLRSRDDPTVDGPAIYETDWTGAESELTWANRPARTGGALDDEGAIGTYRWVLLDVEQVVTGNGTYSFVLASDSIDAVLLRSREEEQFLTRPQLVLTYQNGN